MGSNISLQKPTVNTVPTSSLTTTSNTFIINIDTFDVNNVIPLVKKLSTTDEDIRFFVDTLVYDEFLWTHPENYFNISFVRKSEIILNIQNTSSDVMDYTLAIEMN